MRAGGAARARRGRRPGAPAHASTSADPAGADALAALAARLGSGSARPPRLLEALTHPSYANEHPTTASNEALAFLGDAVLGLVVADLLLAADPHADPGALTAWRAEIVSTRGLAAWARELGVDACVRLGRGEEQGGGRGKESVLATALEAVVGALYLHGGLARVEPLVRRLARPDRPAAEAPPAG